MDPNAALERLRELVVATADENNNAVKVHLADEMAELFEALDYWLTRGGFLPSQWSKRWSK